MDIACTASDGDGSGLANAGDASFNLSTSVANGVENSNASTGSKTVLDAAGNSATAGPIAGNKIDTRRLRAFNCGSADAETGNATNRDHRLPQRSDGGLGSRLMPADANFSLSTNVAQRHRDGQRLHRHRRSSPTQPAASVTAGPITGIKVDKKAPALVSDGPTTPALTAANGWYKSAVTNGFTATDGGSGFAPSGDLTILLQPGPVARMKALTVKIASGAVSDAVGNSTASIDSAAFKIDLSDPTNVAFIGGPAAGSSHDFGSVPAAPTCTADGCRLWPQGLRRHRLQHRRGHPHDDRDGHRQRWSTRPRRRCSYTVLAASAKGFYQPVDMNGVYNTVKGGSTVPLKFELFRRHPNRADHVTTITSVRLRRSPARATARRCHRRDRHRRHEPPLRHHRWPVHLQLEDAYGRGQLLQGDDDRKHGSTITAYFKLK